MHKKIKRKLCSRYAGLYFTRPETYDKVDCKGIETVRRDNCPMVAKMMNSCLQKILIERNPPGAVEYVKQVVYQIKKEKSQKIYVKP